MDRDRYGVDRPDRWRHVFSFMKDVRTLDDVATRSIPVLDASGQPIGYLRPIGADVGHDRLTVRKLAAWRAAHEYAYPSRGPISEESTASWVNNAVAGNRERLLFLILDQFLRPVGHLGLLLTPEDGIEIDNVLRGEAAVGGLMRAAMLALESWALAELDVDTLTLRVLQSNDHAVAFYTSLGYVETRREPLAWAVDGDRRVLIASTRAADDHFCHMQKDLRASEPAGDRILTAGPLIGVKEATYVLDATRRGWNHHHSDYLAKFESDFAAFVRTDFAMATSSCTGALHLALLALGVGQGDEVIVPETTWVATGAAVAYVGATPVFAEVEPMAWTISPEAIEKCITPRTKVIIPVHLYGYPADMISIKAIADRHGIKVVEDAAPAIGATVGGQPVGSFGDMAAFSFQGAKMLVTGEGGMLVTCDPDLRARAWKQQDHGRIPGTFWIDELGRKYKMSNVSAALGLAQLQSARTQIDKKRRINAWYREFLSDTPGIRFQVELPDTDSVCWMTSVTVDDEAFARDYVVQALAKDGIDTRPVFPPIGSYPIWGEMSTQAHPVAEWIGERGINLPSGVRLSRSSVMRVCETLDRVLRGGE